MAEQLKELQKILAEKKTKMEIAPTVGEQTKLQREVNVLQQEINFLEGK